MEVLYPRCAGLDVHSRCVNACVRIAAGRKGPSTGSLRLRRRVLELAAWLTEAGWHVAMEATGVYSRCGTSSKTKSRSRWCSPTRSTSGTFRAARATGTTRPGSPTCARADSGQLRAAGPDPGTARPDADPQATGPRDHAAHATPAEDARRREREVDARGHRHPGRQRPGDPGGAHRRGDPERLADCTTGRLKADRADIIAAVHGRVTAHHLPPFPAIGGGIPP